VAREIVQLGETLRNLTQTNSMEFAAMLDAERGTQIGAILGGVSQSVDIGPHLNAMRAERQYVHLHTHPANSSFSDTDVGVLLSYRAYGLWV